MKDYTPGTWGLSFIFSCQGSVFPKAFVVALPNACVAVATWWFWHKTVANRTLDDASTVSAGQVWSAFNFVTGFIVSFRAQRAYSRWWEGGTLLQQARGEWFNAYSSLIAFCSHDNEKTEPVAKFQHALSRLISLIHAVALMSICTEDGLDFEIIDASGFEHGHMEYLRHQPDKCEIIMQWIQRMVVENTHNGVLPIAPPILSRVFQELSRGIVNIHNVRKITEFQFPFPLAQMIMTCLIVQWFLTPLVTGLLVATPFWAAGLSFFPVFACWGINYVAAEIEQPFGTDANDMPLHYMQSTLNTSILALLDPEAQNPPNFDMEKAHVQETFPEPSKSGKKVEVLEGMRSVRFVAVRDPDDYHRKNVRLRGSDLRLSMAGPQLNRATGLMRTMTMNSLSGVTPHETGEDSSNLPDDSDEFTELYRQHARNSSDFVAFPCLRTSGVKSNWKHSLGSIATHRSTQHSVATSDVLNVSELHSADGGEILENAKPDGECTSRCEENSGREDETGSEPHVRRFSHQSCEQKSSREIGSGSDQHGRSSSQSNGLDQSGLSDEATSPTAGTDRIRGEREQNLQRRSEPGSKGSRQSNESEDIVELPDRILS